MHANLQNKFEKFLFREQLLNEMKKHDIDFTKIDEFDNDKKTNLNVFTNKIIFDSKMLNQLLTFIKNKKQIYIIK